MRPGPAALCGWLALVLLTLPVSVAGQPLATLRHGVPLDEEGPAPPIPPVENTDRKRERSYPMQAPTIPHKIDNYQVDRYGHKCMTCHARGRVEASQAPMISVTHFMDRDGNFLATLSPRRYFCNQCHVPQHEVSLPVQNRFQDAEQLIRRRLDAQGR